MLRLIGSPGPLGTGRKLDSHEVADFAVNAVSHLAGELLPRTGPAEFRANRYSCFQLQTGSGWGNIFNNPIIRRFLPIGSFHVMLTMSAHSMRGSVRRSCITGISALSADLFRPVEIW